MGPICRGHCALTHPAIKRPGRGSRATTAMNAVAPSIMDTPANRKSMPKADFDAWPKVEEVAAAIMFLASPDNKVTRGAIVPVYGKF